MLKVAIDVDGILADFPLAFSRLANEMFGGPIVNNYSQIPTWSFEDWYPIGKEKVQEVWRTFLATENVWELVPPLVSPEEFHALNLLRRHADVVYVTSRRVTPGYHPAIQTETWLIKHMIIDPHVVIAHDKGQASLDLDIDYFLDDSPTQCESLLRAGRSVVCTISYPYNALLPAEVIRFNNVSEFAMWIESKSMQHTKEK